MYGLQTKICYMLNLGISNPVRDFGQLARSIYRKFCIRFLTSWKRYLFSLYIQYISWCEWVLGLKERLVLYCNCDRDIHRQKRPEFYISFCGSIDAYTEHAFWFCGHNCQHQKNVHAVWWHKKWVFIFTVRNDFQLDNPSFERSYAFNIEYLRLSDSVCVR